MILLELILSLSLVQYGFAAPNIMGSLQNVGVDRTPVRLSSDQSASIKQELDHPINGRDRDEFFNKIEKRERIRYHIPQTETTISVRVRAPLLGRGELMDGIMSTMGDVYQVLNLYGDGPLPQNSDPYMVRFPGDLLLRVQSRYMRHLTYQIVWNCLSGLLEVLINQNHINEVIFDIEQRGFGRVGTGFIRRIRHPTRI